MATTERPIDLDRATRLHRRLDGVNGVLRLFQSGTGRGPVYLDCVDLVAASQAQFDLVE